MTEHTHEQLKQIKQSFRLLMNGVTSQSMRSKGLDYKINWGVPLPELQKMALEYGKDFSLAVELWKEDIRECKILATLIMPPAEMSPDLVDLWMEQTHSQEMAEMATFHLYQHLEYAPVLAYQWIAAADPIHLICGFNLLARLFARGQEPNERGISEFVDQCLVALQDESLSVRHAALACLQKFSALGADYEEIAGKALKSINFTLF